YEIITSQLAHESTVLKAAVKLVEDATQTQAFEDLGALDMALGTVIKQLEDAAKASLEGTGLVLDRKAMVEGLAVGGTGAAVTAVIGAAAGVAGMFRTDYAITGKDVTIGATPLVVALTHQLLQKQVPVTVDGFGLADSDLIRAFWTARTQRSKLEELNSGLK